MTYRFLVVGSLYNIYCTIVLNQSQIKGPPTTPPPDERLQKCPLPIPILILVHFYVIPSFSFPSLCELYPNY